jgi:propanol-preferring alcohol dehydrogenase
VLNGTSVIGSIVGTRADLATMFALHRAGRTPWWPPRPSRP